MAVNTAVEEVSNSPQPPHSSNISQDGQQQNSSQNTTSQNNQQSPHIQVPPQHLISPNGQVISVQGPIHSSGLHSNQLVATNGVNPSNQVIGSGNANIVLQGQQSQQRIFISGQPVEPNGPGRPNLQVVPVTISTSRQDSNGRLQQSQYNQQPQYQGVMQQFDANKVRGPFIQHPGSQVVNGYRPSGSHQHNQIVQNPVMINPQQKVWQRMPNIQANILQQNQIPIQQNQHAQLNSNVYERVPPLHQHSPSTTVWTDEINKKKIKIKTVKKRPYSLIDGQHRTIESQGPCPNIDVRQIQNEQGRPVVVNQYGQQNQNPSSSPSFMEDPSGYLAQQTALLNSTISRQTGNFL